MAAKSAQTRRARAARKAAPKPRAAKRTAAKSASHRAPAKAVARSSKRKATVRADKPTKSPKVVAPPKPKLVKPAAEARRGAPPAVQSNGRKLALPPRSASGGGPRVTAVAPKRSAIAASRTAPPAKPTNSKPAASARPVPVLAPPPPMPKSSTYLNKKDLAQFRDMLMAKRAQLVGDVTTMTKEVLSRNQREASGDLSSMPLHMADLGTDSYEQEFTLGLIEGEQNLLREIDAALKRIDSQTYGICLATHKPIGKARLKAKPWAKYCYEHELAQERGRMRRF